MYLRTSSCASYVRGKCECFAQHLVTLAVLADPNHKMYDADDGRFVEKLIVGDLDGGEQELFWFKAGHPPVLPAGLTVPHDASGVNSSLRHFADSGGRMALVCEVNGATGMGFWPRKTCRYC
jgi:hypothetical protein